jgi:hypothetical protein
MGEDIGQNLKNPFNRVGVETILAEVKLIKNLIMWV